MSLNFNFPSAENSVIKVIGVGGGGGNAVTSMFNKGIRGVNFVICNTDGQVLQSSPVPTKVRLGPKLTNGEGCGGDPGKGKLSAEESMDELEQILRENTRMVFITAGMGGGTGTGAAPVIAKMAKSLGILTVGICTTPFNFEGDWRMQIARDGIAELEKNVDSLLIINNQNLIKVAPKKISKAGAYQLADKVLWDAARGIADIITVTGYVNVDFADVSTIMRESGTALMGTASAKGDDRAQIAIEEALSSPLLENVDILGATGVLLNISATEDSLTLDETEIISSFVLKAAGNQARIIIGEVYDESLGDELRVTVIATGFNKSGYVAPFAEKKNIIINSDRKPIVSSDPVQPAFAEVKVEKEFEVTVKPDYHNDFFERRQVEAEVPFEVMNARPVKNPDESFSILDTDIEAAATPFVASATTVVYEQPVVSRTVYVEEEQAAPIQRRLTPEERLQKMNAQNMDLRNQNVMNQMENVPAYKRKNIDLSEESEKKKFSNLTVQMGSNGQYGLSDNNPYLFKPTD